MIDVNIALIASSILTGVAFFAGLVIGYVKGKGKA